MHDSGTDTINGTIRSFRGSNGDDVITGSAEDEWFIPQAGNDTIDGGGGTDTLRYGRGGTTGPLEINFATGVATGSFEGQAFTDSFSNIERVRGTRFDDTIIGDSGDQIFVGNVGDDTITGGGGADTYVLGHVEVSVAGANGGTDTITDFEIGTDEFDFSELGLTNNQIAGAFAAATTPQAAHEWISPRAPR